MHHQCPVLHWLDEEKIMNPDNQLNQLTLGVDTHLDVHVAVLLNGVGKLISTKEFPVCYEGYKSLLKWTFSFGHLACAGIEGTGTYGAGLCKHLLDNGIDVYEVNRPNRAKRILVRKSDPIDADIWANLLSTSLLNKKIMDTKRKAQKY